jgi:hypothetical protein
MSGCVGVDSYESDKPSIEKETLNEEEYTLENQQTFLINNSRNILGVQAGVEVESHINTYAKSSSNLEINLSKSSLKTLDLDKFLADSNTTITEILGKNRTIDIISNNTEFDESSVRLFLNNGGEIEEYIESNDINITEYVDQKEVLNSLTKQQKKDIISDINPDIIGSIFSIISTRPAGILGTELNPLILGDSEDLIKEINNQSENRIRITEFEGSFEINTSDDRNIQVDMYSANITIKDSSKVNSKILVSRKRVGGNVLVMAGLYPSITEERKSISALMEKSRVKGY